MQASLALAAPKIQGSNAAELLVQGSNALKRVQGCPQIFTDLLRLIVHVPSFKWKVEGAETLGRVAHRFAQIHTDLKIITHKY